MSSHLDKIAFICPTFADCVGSDSELCWLGKISGTKSMNIGI